MRLQWQNETFLSALRTHLFGFLPHGCKGCFDCLSIFQASVQTTLTLTDLSVLLESALLYPHNPPSPTCHLPVLTQVRSFGQEMSQLKNGQLKEEKLAWVSELSII